MNNLKYRFKLISSLLMIILSVFCLTFTIHHEKKQNLSAAQPVYTPVSSANTGFEYFLCERDGEIVVFNASDLTVPYISTGILTSGLREIDRESIQRGILLSDITEVWQLIEDFGS